MLIDGTRGRWQWKNGGRYSVFMKLWSEVVCHVDSDVFQAQG